MISIAVFGASGKSGFEIINLAIKKEFSVNAFCRDRSSITLTNKNLRVIQGDLLRFNEVKPSIANVDCVIIAIGTKPPYSDIFCYESTKNIIKSMYDFNMKRLICITGAMIGDYPELLSGFMKKLKKRFNKKYPLISLDRLKQEMAVKASGLNWTLIKPPRLTNGSLSKYSRQESMNITGFSSISRKTISQLIFDIIDDKSTFQKAFFVKK